jgi:hypothetical protein
MDDEDASNNGGVLVKCDFIFFHQKENPPLKESIIHDSMKKKTTPKNK